MTHCCKKFEGHLCIEFVRISNFNYNSLSGLLRAFQWYIGYFNLTGGSIFMACVAASCLMHCRNGWWWCHHTGHGCLSESWCSHVVEGIVCPDQYCGFAFLVAVKTFGVAMKITVKFKNQIITITCCGRHSCHDFYPVNDGAQKWPHCLLTS